ncbi:MAG: CPBP family intramembrane glutamic endopeptidase [Candidatus Dormibacteraceae bacterium]
MNFLFYILPLFVIAWTIWDTFNYRKLKIALKKGQRTALLKEYKVIVAGELVSGAIALGAIGSTIFQPLPAFGINIGESAPNGLIVGGAIGLLASLFILPILARQGKKVTFGDIAALLPQTHNEKLWFGLVAISAGFCEELVFRGYALRLLHSMGLTGILLLLISAVAFGLVHIYQGVGGVLVTAALGAFLAVLYIQTGSLWWAILAHAFIDLRILLLPVSPERSVSPIDGR